MRSASGLALLASIIVAGSSVTALAALQDFNANPSNLANGTPLPANYFPGITTSNAILVYQGPTNPAFAFDFPNGGTSGDFVSNPTNFNGNFLGPQGIGTSAAITITFQSPVSNVSFWIADVDVNESYVFSTYDASNNPINTLTLNAGAPGTGDGVATLVSILGAGVTTLTVAPNLPINQVGYGLDDLQYNVPEPSSAAMLIAMIGAVALRPTARHKSDHRPDLCS